MTNTENMTHDVLAACGIISPEAAASWAADPMPGDSREHAELCMAEVRETADLAVAAGDRAVAGYLYSWVGYHMTTHPGRVFEAMAARAAFGYRHRLLHAEQNAHRRADMLN